MESSYSERLERSIGNFEREADKLIRIGTLIDDAARMSEELQSEKTLLSNTVTPLRELIEVHQKNSQALLELINAQKEMQSSLEAAVEDGLKKINQTQVTANSSIATRITKGLDIISTTQKTAFEGFEAKLAEGLKNIVGTQETMSVNIAARLAEGLNKINRTQNATLDETRANISELLKKRNTDTNEVFDGINDVLSDKISAARSVLESTVRDEIRLLGRQNNQLEKRNTQLEEKVEALTNSIQALEAKINDLQFIKNAAIGAAGASVLACVIGLLK